MNSTKIIINAKSKSYPIYFGNNILSQAGKLINKNIPNVNKVSIVVDKKVPKTLLKKLIKTLHKYKVKIYFFNVSEKIKNFNTAQRLIENLIKDNLNRSDCIIAFGGGVIGDLAGFASSLTKRGMNFINIPTTLLAQVDASIGGKTAVNSKQGKNLIGTFYQPDFVLTDISMLKSLSYREMICGYAEILKHSMIMDRKFFFFLTKNAEKIVTQRNLKLLKIAIIKSCKIKAKIILKDEKEKNSRKILNFGHTFGHGFEGAKNFSKKLNHGESVLLGMLAAINFAYRRKFFSASDLNLITKHYNKLNLPMKIKKIFKKSEIKKILNFMKKDKKNLNNKINLILIKKIGSKPIEKLVSDIEILNFLKKYYNQ